MPSKPKGKSEYDTNYKWFESFRARGFKPAAEQIAPAAGQDSIFSKISHEPALQHKKRVDGPPSTFSINLDDGNSKSYDDFALLGKQQKFAPNVRYGLRAGNGDKAEEDKVKDINNNNNNNNNANVPPPPKQMKMGEKQTRVRQRQDVTETRSKKEARKENLTPTTPPPAPRKGDNQQMEKQGLKDKNLADILPKSKMVAREKGKEGVRLNMDKGVRLADEEAAGDYSLKYKAGMAPGRAVRKPSEYQKEFTWKKGMPASPLLSAEQLIHNSNTYISPTKKTPLQKRTEYQMQFKAYKVPEASPPRAPKPSQEAPAPAQRGRSKTQMKRSKSVGAGLSPERIVAAGSTPVTFADDPRMLRESCNASPVPKVPLAHGKLKHKVSEYNSNYRSPTRFSYEGGAWKYAYPAHLLQNKNDGEGERVEKREKRAEVEKGEEEKNWFNEVLELRRRANEYKRRAQGTHFSREHLVQLLGQQTGYWDADSARSSRLSSLEALALEPAKPPAGVPSFSSKAEVPVDKLSTMAVQGDPQGEEGEGDSSFAARNTLRPAARKEVRRGRRSKKAWQEEAMSEMEADVQDNLNTNQNAAWDVLSVEDVDEMGEAGRLPTPVLRQRGEKPQRHHLDRTTPSVGGVLLSVPAQQLSSRSGDSEETLEESERSLKQKLRTKSLYTAPTLGKPTPDTHALRDETAESDHPMDVQYIACPKVSLAQSDRNLKALQRRMNANIPTTIDERMGETYKATGGNFSVDDLPLVKTREREDDVLSLSAQSMASSCSLASEVYERAKQRRDNFWGKGTK